MKQANKVHWLLVLALALIPVFVVGATGTPPAPVAPVSFATASLPAEAQELPAFPLEKRGERGEKMDSMLWQLAETAVAAPLSLTPDQFPALNFHQGRVQVQASTDAAHIDEAIGAFTAAGGDVTGAAFEDTLIQGWLPPGALQTVAGEESVFYLRQPTTLTLFELNDSAISEAVSVINASAWHNNNYRGAGVKVAIIDGGFSGYKNLLGNDLPANVIAKNFVDEENEDDSKTDGTTPHGTACAEIVHDIAPWAQLYLIKINTDLDLAEAVDYAIDQDIDIISTSLGWYNVTPGDGTGQFATMVQRARDAGILWATAAGNDREAHWGGEYSDPEKNSYHNFDGPQEINFFGPGNGEGYLLPANYFIHISIRWNDWTSINQDYDLFLFRQEPGGSWSLHPNTFGGQNRQTGMPGQRPVENVVAYTYGDAAFYGFAIQRISGNRPVNFEVFALPNFSTSPLLDEVVYTRSLANLADASAAMTVAALDVSAPYPQESYSSEGPTNGPGGTAGGGFIKPDIAAFANVSTISYGTGTGKFNGTSAATPHVAGAAALVKEWRQDYPTISASPGGIQSYLEFRAVDMGAAGMDSIFGHGRLDLGNVIHFDEFVYLPLTTR